MRKIRKKSPAGFPVSGEQCQAFLNEMEPFWVWFEQQFQFHLDRIDVELWQYRALKALAEEKGATREAVAGRLGLSPSQGGRKLEELEKTGWVSTRVSTTDGRERETELTQQGKEKLVECKQELEHLMERLVRRYPEPEQAEILESVRKLNRVREMWPTEFDDFHSRSGRELRGPGEAPPRKERHSFKAKGGAPLTGAAGIEIDSQIESKT